MSALGSYAMSKLVSNPLGFVKAGSNKVIFASKNFVENAIEDWSALEKSSKKSITKIFYCRSPLEKKKQDKFMNALTTGLFGSEMMHHELIFEVDDEIYFLIYYGQEGLLIQKGLDKDELLGLRPDNKIIMTKQGGDKLEKLIGILKKKPHSKENYEPVLYNCQMFSKSIWSQF